MGWRFACGPMRILAPCRSPSSSPLPSSRMPVTACSCGLSARPAQRTRNMTDLPESQQSRTTGQHAHNGQKSEPTFTNRLIHESSPYLLQHAHNPVDWYPWGPEALEKARAEDKPILLSVGYSACHWCHRLREESFEDEATAAIINRSFVSIKVDREERPDIDALYMDAVQALTGSGGWPMTVFLTPDGAPFYGGTYYPPED